jgi:hypothetical protein
LHYRKRWLAVSPRSRKILGVEKDLCIVERHPVDLILVLEFYGWQVVTACEQ